MGSQLPGCAFRGHSPPAIVLIVIDTLRADHTSLGGYSRPTTPELQRLASQADVYERAQAAAPWTYPSMTAIMTGQHPGSAGITLGETVVPPHMPLFAEFMHRAGYRTSAVVAAHAMKQEMGLSRGFGFYDDSKAGEGRFFKANDVFDTAWTMINQRNDAPFFQYIHLWDPHYPYYLHPEHDFMPDYRGNRASGEWPDVYNSQVATLRPEDKAFIKALYDSEIAFTDRELGRFLDRLKEAGLFDDALIVVTSDHGEEFGERGWYGHQWSLHQELLHVPLVVKWPGQDTRANCGYATHVDLAPTILQAAGCAETFQGDGQPLQEGNSWIKRPLFSQTVRNKEQDQFHKESVDQVSLLYGDKKVILNNLGRRLTFFDLTTDAREKNPRHYPENDLEKELVRTLEKTQNLVKRRFMQLPLDQKPGLIPEELRTRLRSLGYL